MVMRALPYLVAIGLVLGALFGAYRHGVTTERATWQVRMNAALAEAMSQTADLQRKAREAEQASAQAMQTIDNAYQQGRADAQNDFDRTMAERDSGAIRLHDRFTCTDTSAAGGLPEASTSTSKRDAARTGGLQREDEAFLVQLAKRADDAVRQLQACQSIVRKDRGQ